MVRIVLFGWLMKSYKSSLVLRICPVEKVAGQRRSCKADEVFGCFRGRAMRFILVSSYCLISASGLQSRFKPVSYCLIALLSGLQSFFGLSYSNPSVSKSFGLVVFPSPSQTFHLCGAHRDAARWTPRYVKTTAAMKQVQCMTWKASLTIASHRRMAAFRAALEISLL